MKIESDFPLQFDRSNFIKIQGKNFSNLLKKPKISAKFNEILSELPKLYEPQLIWEKFAILNIVNNAFQLKNNRKIGGGPVTLVMKEATEILIGICTIGNKIDCKIEEYNQTGDLMSVVILDGIASFLVDQIREKFILRINQKLRSDRYFSSIPLCPGESEWSVKDHTIFFDLLKPEQIGIELKPSMLMIPMKSLSFMIGVSKKPFGLKNKERCDFCSMRLKCRYSKLKLEQKFCD